jgi:hypothetical protein
VSSLVLKLICATISNDLWPNLCKTRLLRTKQQRSRISLRRLDCYSTQQDSLSAKTQLRFPRGIWLSNGASSYSRIGMKSSKNLLGKERDRVSKPASRCIQCDMYRGSGVHFSRRAEFPIPLIHRYLATPFGANQVFFLEPLRISR